MVAQTVFKRTYTHDYMPEPIFHEPIFYFEVVSTYFLLTVAGYFAGDSTNRRGCDLTVGTDESGGSGAKDPQMLIKENNNSSFLTFVNK